MTLKGVILEFDERTWWGRASYDLEVIDFHGTCVIGYTKDFPIKSGQKCNIIFNDSHRLLSIEVL